MSSVFDDIEDSFDRMFFDNEEEQQKCKDEWDGIRNEIFSDFDEDLE